jgi:hypothetical protein
MCARTHECVRRWTRLTHTHPHPDRSERDKMSDFERHSYLLAWCPAHILSGFKASYTLPATILNKEHDWLLHSLQVILRIISKVKRPRATTFSRWRSSQGSLFNFRLPLPTTQPVTTMASSPYPFILHTTPPVGSLPASDPESIYLAALLHLGAPGRFALQTADWGDNGGK